MSEFWLNSSYNLTDFQDVFEGKYTIGFRCFFCGSRFPDVWSEMLRKYVL